MFQMRNVRETRPSPRCAVVVRRRTLPAMGPTVLVVDDEPMVREVVARYLELDGMRVFEVGDGASAQDWLDHHQPDLVVLDVMLPQIDGLSILRKLRAVSSVPVILLTARAEDRDRVVGLELGADDYVIKPFSPRELAARVRTVLRRTGVAGRAGGEVAQLEFGDLVLNCSSREVLLNGSVVGFTPKEFDLLALLARSAPAGVFQSAVVRAGVVLVA